MAIIWNGDDPKRQKQKQRFAVAQKGREAARGDRGGAELRPAGRRAQSALGKRSSSTSRFLIHWRIFAGKLLKSDLWETLAIIGVTQLVVLPWIGCGFLTRFSR